MEQLGKRDKIIPIPWACPVFPLASFTLALVGTNIEKRDMKFVTEKFSPPSLRNNKVDTVFKYEGGVTNSQALSI